MPAVSLPARTKLGTTAMLRFQRADTTAALHIVHLDVIDPASRVVGVYSGNVRLSNETASWPLPFAVNDAVGLWRVRVTDVLTGRTMSSEIAIEPIDLRHLPWIGRPASSK
jgi:hypothetical protein